MRLFANYSELSEFIREKTGKDINLEYGGNAETVLAKCMHVPVYVSIDRCPICNLIIQCRWRILEPGYYGGSLSTDAFLYRGDYSGEGLKRWGTVRLVPSLNVL